MKRTAIQALMKRAKDYVELEANTRVTDIKYIESFTLFGKEDAVFLAKTTWTEYPEWWVVGGDTPINLYSKDKLSTADEAFSFHTGIMLRLLARQHQDSPENVGYDAFICHASEDKADFVRPLAHQLAKMGFLIWYDEFELKVGDSLRGSIDKGLTISRYGIVVLSKAFFAKNWPQYELNGLVARELEGEKVILPIWKNVSKQDILQYSPPLADKVAACFPDKTVKKVAEELAKVLSE